MRSLEGLAILLGRWQAGNRHWLASQGLSVVLDLEGSSWPTRASTGVQRDSAADSQDEPRQSAGVRHASMGNCSSWASTSAKPAWASTSYAGAIHPRKPGRPSWRITSRAWSRSCSVFHVSRKHHVVPHDRSGEPAAVLSDIEGQEGLPGKRLLILGTEKGKFGEQASNGRRDRVPVESGFRLRQGCFEVANARIELQGTFVELLDRNPVG